MRAATAIKSAVQAIIRMGASLLGAFLVAVLPVMFWADARQQANAETGLLPNMDPGVAVAIAIAFVVLVLCVASLVEVVRIFAFERKPLTVLSCFVLGAVATWPISTSLLVERLNFGRSGVALAAISSLSVFYLARWMRDGNRHPSQGRAIDPR